MTFSPPLTTTLDELERLLAAATQEPELDNQSEVGSDLPWGPPVQGPIAWIIREHGNGAQIGNFLLHADAALAVAAVNVLPALIAAAKENLRPRWHHDWDLPPEDRHYCEECSALITEVRQLRAAEPAPPTEALELRALFDQQQTRMERATAMWQAGTGNEDTLPDLGRLLDWLIELIDPELLAVALHDHKAAYVVLGDPDCECRDEARRYLAATEEAD